MIFYILQLKCIPHALKTKTKRIYIYVVHKNICLKYIVFVVVHIHKIQNFKRVYMKYC